MTLNFCKMHGIGNDYIYIDCAKNDVENPAKLAQILSDRNFGVGGDGVVLIDKSDIADAKMRMFNMDGSEGKMCGNAIRCVAKYLHDGGQKNSITIETLSGVKTLQIFAQNGVTKSVKVDMAPPILTPADIPVKLDGDAIIGREITVLGESYNITCVSMGNPHAVIFVEDVENLEITKIGPQFEKNAIFAEGVNTEFVQCMDDGTFKMRVWERGSGETLACGTGACAVAVALVLNGKAKKNEEITVRLRGGDLQILYTDETVYMTGSATKVFDGIININDEGEFY